MTGIDMTHIYQQYRKPVLGYLRSYIHDRDTAEDLTSEVFERALRRINDFQPRPDATIGSWLIRIAHNRLVDHIRAYHRHPATPTDDLYLDQIDVDADPAIMTERDHLADSVRAAMRVLTPAQHEALTLRYLRGLTVPETAACLGSNTDAVKALTYRACRVMLRSGEVNQWR